MSDKKVAIVTGAANGIGEAAAKLFAREGYAVAIMDTDEKVHGVRDAVAAAGGECHAKQCDVSKEPDVVAFVGDVMKKYGRIDVLNNNAGIVVVKPLEETTWEDYRRVGPLTLSLDHRGADGSFRVWFTDVAVRLAGQSAWISAQ